MSKEIRAFYDQHFIRVYQAYNNLIAESALKYGKFLSPPFKLNRTTWIKPSFLWMMYRSGWATKENQEKILAIDITHEGLLWALEHSRMSNLGKNVHTLLPEQGKSKPSSPTVIQWDPERDIHLNKLPCRAIQIGLSPEAVKLYNEQWIINISDTTLLAKKIKSAINNNDLKEAKSLLPEEKSYPLSDSAKQKIGINI